MSNEIGSRRLNGLRFRMEAHENEWVNPGPGAGDQTQPPGGGFGLTPPPPPPQPSNLDQFINFLMGKNGRGGQNQFFTGAADRLLGQSQGVDPLFDQYRQAQLGLLGSQQAQQVGALQGGLSRRGITGSAALNEVNKLNQGFNQQGQVLSSQIGLQGLGRSDQSLQDSLAARAAAITQAGYPAALDIAGLAAANAGKGGNSGGGGGSKTCMILCLILTDMLMYHGDLTWDQYFDHAKVSKMKSTPSIYAGYIRWAGPLADVCEDRPRLYCLVRWAVRSYVMDAIGARKSLLGASIGILMRSLS